MKGQRNKMVHRKFVIMVCALAASLLSFTGPAHAATTDDGVRLRVIAYKYAVAQAGKRYCWGGDGPSCYDCSGLVYEAYLQAGIQLPRTTYGMLASPLLVQISRSQAKRGDLAFFGPGHVEMVDIPDISFGADTYGTQIGWTRSSPAWQPTAYYRIRGAGRTT
jgi:cell wall-associated NlpC family hydrolase